MLSVLSQARMRNSVRRRDPVQRLTRYNKQVVAHQPCPGRNKSHNTAHKSRGVQGFQRGSIGHGSGDQMESKFNLCMSVPISTKQLTKYYHASLGSHPKRTLVAAIKRGYLKGFKGLTAERVNTHIGVEYAMEVGHMRALPKSVRSTTSISKRGRPKKS